MNVQQQFLWGFCSVPGKTRQGWWSEALGAPWLVVWINGTRDPPLRGEAEPHEDPTKKVPAEIRATYPLPRVRDARYTFEVLPWHGGEEGNVLVSSAPRIPGTYIPEALAKAAVRTGATQGVGEMNQGPLVSCWCVSRTSLC